MYKTSWQKNSAGPTSCRGFKIGVERREKVLTVTEVNLCTGGKTFLGLLDTGSEPTLIPGDPKKLMEDR